MKEGKIPVDGGSWDTARVMCELRVHQEELEIQKAALQHSLERLLEEYTLLYDFAPVGYMSLDCNGCIQKSNHALKVLVGMSKSKLLDLPFTRFVAQEDRLRFVAFLKRIFGEIPGKKTCALKINNGKQKTIFVQMEAQVVGSGGQCLVAVIDVTELRLEEHKFHIMADNTYAWEFWLGTDNRFIYVSPSCKQITGYDASDFMADPTLMYSIIYPEDRHSFYDCCLKFHSARVNFEYRIVHRSGSIHWIRHDGKVIMAADGTCLGLRGSNLDVTAEHQLKQQLVHSLDELKRLTTELNLSEERERRRIASVLHDQVVQNLAIGNLSLDAALKKGEMADHPVLQELKTLLESSMRDLRDLSLDLSSPVLYDMGLSAAISSLGRKLEKKFGFRFVFHSECAPEATLEENLAISAFQFCRELVTNAGKYAGAATVTVFLCLKDDQLILNIYDDGSGFEVSECREGFGIVNIRQRVNYLKGSFKIQSVAGTGTSVEIVFNTKNE